MPLSSCALDLLNLLASIGADFRLEPEPQLASWITFDPDDLADFYACTGEY